MFTLSIAEGLALSASYEGFAWGLVSLRTPPLLGRKSFKAKSHVSISSKLIQTKRLQVLYSGHLRKTGGRESYRLVHTLLLLGRKPSSVKSNYSGHPTKDVHPEPAEGLFSYQVQSFPHLRDTRGGGSGPTREKRRRIGSQQCTAVSYQPEKRGALCDGNW